MDNYIVPAIIGGIFTVIGSFCGSWFTHYLQTRWDANKNGKRPTTPVLEIPDETASSSRDTDDWPKVTTTTPLRGDQITPYLSVFGVFFLAFLMAFIWLAISVFIAYEGPDSPMLVPVIWLPGAIPIIILLYRLTGFASVVAFIVLQILLLIVLSAGEAPSPIAVLCCILGLLITAAVLRLVATRKLM